jgi:phosphatidylethanolamine/phosphatidyl-N-methylethanolamine N-methyltransferase
MDKPAQSSLPPTSRVLSFSADKAAPSIATDLSRAQVETSYRRYAPLYDLLFGASLGPGRHAMTRLVRRLAPESILEVGVGTGLALPEYPVDARITGIDVSDEMLAVARRRVRAGDDARIALHAMDAEEMEFADGTFDCVTLPYVLSVTPNPDRLVAEVRRVCRPGGHIVIVNHFSGEPPWRTLELLARPLSRWLGFRSEFSLQRHVLRHAWEVMSIEPTNLLSLSRLIHIRNV